MANAPIKITSLRNRSLFSKGMDESSKATDRLGKESRDGGTIRA